MRRDSRIFAFPSVLAIFRPQVRRRESLVDRINPKIHPEYTFDDTAGDTSFSDFDISAAPDYVFSTIQDIMAVNPILKVHILPWSPVRALGSAPVQQL